MRVLYIAASGRTDPVRAALPYHLAVNGSAEAGQDVELVLAGDATDLIVDGMIDELEPLGLPPLRDLAAKLRVKAVPVHV